MTSKNRVSRMLREGSGTVSPISKEEENSAEAQG